MRHLILSSLFALGFTLVGATGANDATAETRSLRVLFNSSVHGELHDCGCKRKPLGGLARRAALVESLRSGSPSTVLLDGGNLLEQPRADSLDRSHLVARITADLGYGVIGVGPWDIGHGVDALREIADRSGLHFVSANLRAGDEPLAAPYRIVEIDGLRLGITSVLDPALLKSPFDDDAPEVTATDPVASLEAILPTLREKSDLVVLYSNFDRGGTQELLQSVGEGLGVDLAIEGYATVRYPSLRRVGDTVLVAANSRGKYLGQLDLQVEEATGRLDATVTLHELSLDLPEDPGVVERIEAFESRRTPTQASR